MFTLHYFWWIYNMIRFKDFYLLIIQIFISSPTQLFCFDIRASQVKKLARLTIPLWVGLLNSESKPVAAIASFHRKWIETKQEKNKEIHIKIDEKVVKGTNMEIPVSRLSSRNARLFNLWNHRASSHSRNCPSVQLNVGVSQHFCSNSDQEASHQSPYPVTSLLGNAKGKYKMVLPSLAQFQPE